MMNLYLYQDFYGNKYGLIRTNKPYIGCTLGTEYLSLEKLEGRKNWLKWHRSEINGFSILNTVYHNQYQKNCKVAFLNLTLNLLVLTGEPEFVSKTPISLFTSPARVAVVKFASAAVRRAAT